jgi:hypothetical protein
MRQLITLLGSAVFFVVAAAADAGDAIFEAGDHCVAYRTIKGMFFGFDAEVVGRSCEVSASLVASEDGGGPRVVVSVPVKSLKSGNILRNKTVADLLGAQVQPELRFTSGPIDVGALRGALAAGSFLLPGTLSLGGRAYPIDFPLAIVATGEQRAVVGRLATRFEAFEVEVPTVAGGLIARPHDELELVVHLDVARVEGLEEWARAELPGVNPDRAPSASPPSSGGAGGRP